MAATLTAPLNGSPARRTLNDSIGRLDDMIDGLSQAIPDTIRDTLREQVAGAITEGVRVALTEVLRHPDVIAAMRGQAAPARTLRQRLAEKLAAARRSLRRRLGTLVVRFRTAAVAAGPLRDKAKLVWQARRPVGIALGMGAVAAGVAAIAPGWVATTMTGLGAAATALAVQCGFWVRRVVNRLLPF